MSRIWYSTEGSIPQRRRQGAANSFWLNLCRSQLSDRPGAPHEWLRQRVNRLQGHRGEGIGLVLLQASCSFHLPAQVRHLLPQLAVLLQQFRQLVRQKGQLCLPRLLAWSSTATGGSFGASGSSCINCSTLAARALEGCSSN